ncbi:LSU ribosomal protein L10P [Stackebrandtia endophytica]|uniref:Large ribosomal subunit protein uL10 n=1 Tax=Stackebrandtia endophytica TaxID=1496996 RepID=A0A543AZL0_9ACTN|nr:50S ribosomal protein L10 [Stackebrandtia endophytica]TQL77996.1 LSU ribosomal protein L10P [Stackebrandtia endophytica]
MAERVIPADKVSAVDELTEKFRDSNATVLTEYRGLTVPQLAELRTALGASASYRVSKNTLAKRAAHGAGLTELDEYFSGPTALAFVTGEVVDAAKALRDFAKENEALVIKGGVMDGRAITADELAKIADLDSREVLLSKLAGAMKGSMSKAAALFAAPASKMARATAALRDKKEAAGE